MRNCWKTLFRDIRLRPKLMVLYSACILLPMLLVGSTLFFIVMGSVETQATTNIAQSAKHINLSLNEYMQEMETISYVAYNNKDFQTQLIRLMEDDPQTPLATAEVANTINGVLKDILLITRNIDCISVVSNDKKVYTQSIYGPVRAAGDFFENPIFTGLKQSRGETIVLPTHTANYQFAPLTPVFSVARKLIDFDSGYYIGYLILECNERVFQRIAAETAIGQNGGWMVLTREGELLYGTDAMEEKIAAEDLLKTVTQRTPAEQTVIFNGEKYLLAHHQSEKTGFQVVCLLPYGEVTQTARMTVVLFLILAAFIFSLAIACSALISRSVVQPIQEIREAMKQVQTGDLTVTVPVESENELGELAGSFNELVSRIGGLITVNQAIDQERKIAEMEALKSKINPHFLYNTLETIHMQAVLDDELEIADGVTSLGKMLRYSISGNEDFVPLEQELGHVNHYLYLQKMRYQDRFQVSFEIEPCCMDCKVLKLMIQPIVENALQHGIEKTKKKTMLRIIAKTQDGDFHLTVLDNGCGMTEETLEQVRNMLRQTDRQTSGLHIGMRNVQRRIQLFFGEKYGITIRSVEHVGTRVELTMPICSMESEPDKPGAKGGVS